ncbi:MFS transporter [Lacibacterium aquatile]|uniref:MFS transporter n=1 Tax=Lacibacterium aquatile TaxID=1168082 RepID=A0ABW5DUR8_9PROT
MMLRLLPLILGAFAIGAETFMISGVLPSLSSDLGISFSQSGALVTVFALTYAVGSPVLAVLTGGFERRRVLTSAIAVFALGNVAAGLTTGYAGLVGARVLLALSAGLFMPAAIAYATIDAGPERRGKAVAAIYSGMTMAIVVGVPLATILASAFSWRAAFLGVALLALVALLGIGAFLPRQDGMTTIGLRHRIDVARRPDVLQLLALTTLSLIGPFTISTYIGALMGETLGITGDQLAVVLLIFGLASVAGNSLGGYGADRWNREKFLASVLAACVLSFAIISLGANLQGTLGTILVVAGLALWGATGWAFPSIQQARLVSLDPKLAPVTLSLNTSALYFGTAIGSAFGGLIVKYEGVANIGWGAAMTGTAALILLLATCFRKVSAA